MTTWPRCSTTPSSRRPPFTPSRTRILADFGNVRKLAVIKAGKPSGAWAQAIGLALQERWRERASYPQPVRVGDDRR